jgi:hypothetical protein
MQLWDIRHRISSRCMTSIVVRCMFVQHISVVSRMLVYLLSNNKQDVGIKLA